ncbi:MAG: AraC family transcriptional regulator [Tuberibacillus sp.]
MAWLESLQKSIDYMEKHLLEDLSIEKIAEAAHASPFHFQRTFSILTDMTVGEYVRRRRLTLAAQEIIHTDSKVINLAYKYGYDTPEAFTKAFRRQHGVTPSDLRKGLGKLQSYNRLVIQVNLKGVDPMKYSIVEKEAFRVVGVKREYSYENGENFEEIPKFWDEVSSDGTCDALAKLNNGDVPGILGVCVDKSATHPHKMDYWVATANNSNGEVPEKFLSFEIPASKWAIFEVHGAMPHAIQETWQQIYSEWFPTTGSKHAGTPELELYPEGNAFDPDYYSEIWIPIK